MRRAAYNVLQISYAVTSVTQGSVAVFSFFGERRHVTYSGRYWGILLNYIDSNVTSGSSVFLLPHRGQTVQMIPALNVKCEMQATYARNVCAKPHASRALTIHKLLMIYDCLE